MGLRLLIDEVSRSHSDTSHSDLCGQVISPTQHPYLTTHNTHKRKTSMTPAGFDPAIPASERLQTHTLDDAATGMCPIAFMGTKNRGENAEMKRRSSAVCYVGSLIPMHICEYRRQNLVFSSSVVTEFLIRWFAFIVEVFMCSLYVL